MVATSRRLFFAFWPDQSIRDGIVERRELLGNPGRRRVPDHNLHMTLLFLGNQPADSMESIQAAADRLRPPSMSLCLDRFGWFRSAKVLWLGGEAPEQAAPWVEELGEDLRDLGLRFAARPFVPHVTLYRKIHQRPSLPEPPPLLWSPPEIALIESIPSRPYQVLRTWPVE